MNWEKLWQIILFGFAIGTAGCAGPRSEVEVQHLRDLVQEGKIEYLSDLISALDSKDQAVRSAAIRSLADLGETAVPRLKQTVREDSGRSGPALIALGLGAEPDTLSFIRSYRSHPTLGAAALEAERESERKLYSLVSEGDLEAMESYLEGFPDSPRAQEIRQVRHQRLARSTFTRISAAPTLPALEEFLKSYGDSEDAPAARITLARILIKEAQGRMSLQEFLEARVLLEKAAPYDPRREPEIQRLTAQSFLLEARPLLAEGQTDRALLALERAALFPEFRLESERLQADILMGQARQRIIAGNIPEAMGLLDRVTRLDPVRRPEVGTLKLELSQGFQSKLQSGDPAVRRQALVGMVCLGEESARPMELILGTLFARKDYGGLEEVVQALAEARRVGTPDVSQAGITRIVDLMTTYLKAALATSTGEITRLFGSPEYLRYWNATFDPLDPRQYPLMMKVDELSQKHLGLCRLALGMKALLGEGSVEIVKGSLLQDGEISARLVAGDLGQDPALLLLTRVQLGSRYASTLSDFRKGTVEMPEHMMAYAVGLSVPLVKSADWLQAAEGFKSLQQRLAAGERVIPEAMAGYVRPFRTSLVSLDYDRRSLTLQVYDPVVDALKDSSPETRQAATLRTLAVLLNTSRIAFGLYSGIDRYTILLGSTETPLTSISPVRGGQFDPEVRVMLTQKSYGRLDWNRLRATQGNYALADMNLTDLQWYRWARGNNAP